MDEKRHRIMNIALLAHDNKTELMLQFCTAYCGVLFVHWLYAPATTGNPIQKATRLPVTSFLPSNGGGLDQIATRVSYNEMDMVLFFSDSSNFLGTKQANSLARMCDRNCIPFASNAATAEVLVRGLHQGDLN